MNMRKIIASWINGLFIIIPTLLMFSLTTSAQASIAYGSLNNFDVVNDTGVEAHGFEIELDDIHSKDITYTYDYNHYGVPKITEDNTDPLHPKVTIRYDAHILPDGTWSAFTAIPTAPIAPTAGHQFTNPAVNFGGEHFGVGYYGVPTAVRNFWLIDDGTGKLIHGPPVNIATPTFTYYPPAALPAQVQAIIVPPPPPAPPVFQFGVASWVNDIKTVTHNPNKVKLVDLVDPDPADPTAKDWRNGEPDVIESEWRLLQTEFANLANPKGVLQGLPEDLPGGDEIITRRYEFYKYVGPIDAETGEAMATAVAPDGIHGLGSVTFADHFDPALGEWVLTTVDLTTVVVVGDFVGAQMSGFDVAPALGLIDHIPDGELNIAYADRTVVVAGGAAFLISTSGALPDGTQLDPLTGIFSGTPLVPGIFTFTVNASDTSGANVSKSYTVTIPGTPSGTIVTSALPVLGGSTSGDGAFPIGTPISVIASHNPGFAFINWTEGGVEVSTTAVYPFTVNGDRTLVANFLPLPVITSFAPAKGPVGTLVTLTGTDFTGATAVAFNGTAASSFTVVNATTITATVPGGATNGSISVTTPAGTAISTGKFYLPPTLTSFSPVSGPQGTVVKLTGTNFTGATTIKFNGRIASSFTVVNDSLISTMVPIGATTGTIVVYTPGGTATSAEKFTVTIMRPDLWLRTSSDSVYLGDNIYSTNGATQQRTLSIARSSTGACYLRFQNDGTAADTFMVKTAAAPRGWTVKYYTMVGGIDVTASVIGLSGWSTGVLAIGANVGLYVTIMPTMAVLPGNTFTLKPTVISVSDMTKKDVGQIVTTATGWQPDLWVRASGDASYTGNNLYSTDGATQSRALSIARGATATYYLHVQNDGTAADTFTVKAAAAPLGWTVKYYTMVGGIDVTAAVNSTSGWSTGILAVGALDGGLYLKVTPASSITPGSMLMLFPKTTSLTNGANIDVGRLVTTATGWQPDLWVRASGDASYTGNDIYSTDGATQSRALSIARGTTATYYLHVQNDGTAADTFTVKVAAAPSGWTVKYYTLVGGIDVTAAVNSASGWSTGILATGALDGGLYLKVTPSSSVTLGEILTLIASATSGSSGVNIDVGKLFTTASN